MRHARETAGSWSHQAAELVQDIYRSISDITEDSRETTFLFQRLSVIMQRKNAVSFVRTFFRTIGAIVRRCSQFTPYV